MDFISYSLLGIPILVVVVLVAHTINDRMKSLRIAREWRGIDPTLRDLLYSAEEYRYLQDLDRYTVSLARLTEYMRKDFSWVSDSASESNSTEDLGRECLLVYGECVLGVLSFPITKGWEREKYKNTSLFKMDRKSVVCLVEMVRPIQLSARPELN